MKGSRKAVNGSRHYSLVGWIVWQLTRRTAKKKVKQNSRKLGAAGVVALVLVGGLLAARWGDD
jgi:hypothetical protein